MRREDKPEVHVVLLHYPVLNRSGETVTTAVTNLDIHDNARSSRAFGVSSYHMVTPLDAQVELMKKILGHWREGFGATRIPSRVEAMNLVHISRSLEDAVESIASKAGHTPILVSTCARDVGQKIGYREMRRRMEERPDVPCVLIFGTGYGIADEVLRRSDVVLEPIGTPSDWNHLSVRSAVSITLDRLLGDY